MNEATQADFQKWYNESGNEFGEEWDWHSAHSAWLAATERAADVRPMPQAPRDGTPILLHTNDCASIPHGFRHISFVGKHAGVMEWCFAGPVLISGFIDEWFVGWTPIIYPEDE